MNAYVVGAGVSACVGYPVGSDLLDAIDRYVRESDAHPDYWEDWDALQRWLQNNSNPTIVQAHRTGNIEHLFTALDLVAELRDAALLRVARRDRAARTRHGTDQATTKAAEEADDFDNEIRDEMRHRRTLFLALQDYFLWKHSEDHADSAGPSTNSRRAYPHRQDVGLSAPGRQ